MILPIRKELKTVLVSLEYVHEILEDLDKTDPGMRYYSEHIIDGVKCAKGQVRDALGRCDKLENAIDEKQWVSSRT